jgi:hypothetical protein
VTRSLAALAGLLCAACGYTLGGPAELGPARSYALEVVTNDSFWQRRELELTRALDRELSARLAWRRVAPAQADAVLRVRIRRIDARTLVTGTTAPVREGALRLDVLAELVDPRTGGVLLRREHVDLAEYRPAVGEDRTSAEREAAYDLARRIVEDLADGALDGEAPPLPSDRPAGR